MKIVNKSEQFVVIFDGSDYTIPNGEFEVINDKLGNHILNKAVKWKKDVSRVSEKPIDQIKPISKVEVKPEEPKAFGGASMESLPKKMGRPKKDVTAIA